MKKCYQLVILTEDGKSHDVIFSALKRAERSMKRYSVGLNYCNSIISNVYVMTRVLF